MSKGLENFTNANPVTADYPWKDIKDNTGANDGTPVDRDHHADYHQTFRKLLALASITPNGLPDNVTNGYQYVDALDVLYKNYIGFIGASADTTFTAADINKVVLCSGATIGVVHTLPLGSTLRDGDCITFVNAGSGTVSVVENVGNTIFYNPGTMRTNDYIKLVYSSVLGAWVAVNYQVTPVAALATPNPIYVFKSTNTAGTGTDILLRHPSTAFDLDGAHNVSTGEYTCPKTGYYKVKTSGALNIAAGGTWNIGSHIYKNGVNYGSTTARPIVGYTGGSVDQDYTGDLIVPCVAGDILSFHFVLDFSATVLVEDARMFVEYVNQP